MDVPGFFSCRARPPRRQPSTTGPDALEPSSGRRGIRSDEIAQRFPQGAEPGLVVPPLLDAVLVDRTAYLLRADGTDGSSVGMELQAGGLERQTTVVEQPADLAFRIRDQVLVVDP